MNAAYVQRAIWAAMRLARFDADAVRDFDRSFEGFFRSFFAALLCAPFYPILMFAERRYSAEMTAIESGAEFAGVSPVGTAYYLYESAAYLGYWLTVPVAMIFLARLLRLEAHYVSYIVAYNWATCIVTAAKVPFSLIYLAGLVPPDVFLATYYTLLLLTVAYRWLIAQMALGAPPATIAGIILVDVFLTALIAKAAAYYQLGTILPP